MQGKTKMVEAIQEHIRGQVNKLRNEFELGKIELEEYFLGKSLTFGAVVVVELWIFKYSKYSKIFNGCRENQS